MPKKGLFLLKNRKNLRALALLGLRRMGAPPSSLLMTNFWLRAWVRAIRLGQRLIFVKVCESIASSNDFSSFWSLSKRISSSGSTSTTTRGEFTIWYFWKIPEAFPCQEPAHQSPRGPPLPRGPRLIVNTFFRGMLFHPGNPWISPKFEAEKPIFFMEYRKVPKALAL